MPRNRSGETKAQIFDRLIAEGVEPREAATRAGYTRVDRLLKRRADTLSPAAPTAPTAPAQPLSEKELARRTLAHVATYSDRDTAKVAAARELLKVEPDPQNTGGLPEHTTVVFDRGPLEDSAAINLPYPAAEIAEAICFLRAKREQREQEIVDAYVVQHNVDEEHIRAALKHYAAFPPPPPERVLPAEIVSGPNAQAEAALPDFDLFCQRFSTRDQIAELARTLREDLREPWSIAVTQQRLYPTFILHLQGEA